MNEFLLDRLHARTVCDLKTGCWIWTGPRRGPTGYGQINWTRSIGPILVHRLAYALEHDVAIEKLTGVVMHLCNTPACIRSSHLRLGTQRDNLAHMSAQGRAPRGERSGGAKLTTAQVQEIRVLDATGEYTFKQLGELFGVSATTIYSIVHRINWRHIE